MLCFIAYLAIEDIMSINESIPIELLANRLQNATEGMIFAGVVALTRTAKHGQTAVRDILPDVFNIRNKWTIQGIRITPATKQNQEAEVYSKDWYMPVHEEGGKRDPKPSFWIPSKGLREALGLSIKQQIPRWAAPKNLMKGKRKIGGNVPFYAKMKSHDVQGIFVRTTDNRLPIQLLYTYHLEPVKIPKREWFYHEVIAAYDKYLEVEYNQALLEAWAK